jgi:hypothetical protein
VVLYNFSWESIEFGDNFIKRMGLFKLNLAVLKLLIHIFSDELSKFSDKPLKPVVNKI